MQFMQILLTAILPFSLVLIGLWLIKLGRIRVSNKFELLSIAYVLSLTMIFGILYVGSIFGAFNIASLLVLALMFVSIISLSLSYAITAFKSPPKNIRATFLKRISNPKSIIVFSVIGLISIYALFLSSRAILDSDVAQEYLPISRQIAKWNGFTYSNGYDYNILLKPIGVSVIYAWTSVASGSTFSEAFRLLPLVPIVLSIILNYAIATSVTKSKVIGLVSTAVFLILPFQDRFLLYTAFYPDIFYYPLIFAGVYFFIEYFKSKRFSMLFWTGLALGVGGLLKAQTIYVMIAFMLILVTLELRAFKKLSAVLCCLAPLYILIPSILASSIQNGELHFSIPNFSGIQWVLFSFLCVTSGVFYYYLASHKYIVAKIDGPKIKNLIKSFVLLLVPFALLSGLWYINNFLKFGTFIWTSSINLPNYGWAVNTLAPSSAISSTVSIWHYLAYFTFMPLDPAVMGYFMLIPFIIGLAIVLKRRPKNFAFLMILSMIPASIILSMATVSLPSESGYNPRDIFMLAPLLATLSAVGIVFLASRFCKQINNLKTITLSLLFVGYFGLMSYIHSVFVWFTSLSVTTTMSSFMSSLSNIAGLSLAQTSFQITYRSRAVFIGDNVMRILLLSIIIGLPILILSCHGKLFTKPASKLVPYLSSKKSLSLIRNILLAFVFLSVIIVPRLEIFNTQGGFQGIETNQLKATYGGLHELIADKNRNATEGILTYGAPNGLPYYMPDTKIVDLAYPANLASLKDCLLSNSSYETAMTLRQRGIDYLLINPSTIEKLDASLGLAFSEMMGNPEITKLTKSLGSWKLYMIGPFAVEKATIPLSGWSADAQLTNASYTLNSNESHILLELSANSTYSRITIFNSNASKYDLSKYDYTIVKVDGSNNSRIFLRFFLDAAGNPLDIAYWITPYTLTSVPFDLKSYNATMRGDVYLGLKSSDGLPSSITITEISLAKIKERIPLP